MPRAQQLEIAEPVRETTQRKKLSPEKFSEQLGVSLQNVKITCKWIVRALFQARKLGSRTCFLLEDVQITPMHAAAVSKKTASVEHLGVLCRSFWLGFLGGTRAPLKAKLCGTSPEGAEAIQRKQRHCQSRGTYFLRCTRTHTTGDCYETDFSSR